VTGFSLVVRLGSGHRFKLVIRHLHGSERLIGLELGLEKSMQLLLELFVKRFVLGLLCFKR